MVGVMIRSTVWPPARKLAGTRIGTPGSVAARQLGKDSIGVTQVRLSGVPA
jgi:hypothetical protein